jgi:transcriptional regulator with XRE-family HTH domain
MLTSMANKRHTPRTPGEVVSRERRRRKLSMRACSTLAGISLPTWSELEHDVRPASMSTQRGVSRAFGWPLDWLDQLAEGIDPDTWETNEPLSADGDELRRRIAVLEREVSVLARVVETLVQDVDHLRRG